MKAYSILNATSTIHMAFSGVVTLRLSRHCRHPHLFASRVHRVRPPKLLFYCATQISTISMSSAPQTKLTAPYGSWKSPITADVVSGSEKRLGGFATDSFGRLYWLESRPAESGFVFYLLFFLLLALRFYIRSMHYSRFHN